MKNLRSEIRLGWGVLICLVVNMTLHTSFWKIQIPKMPFNVESLNFQSQCYGGVIVWFSQFSVHDLSVFTYVQELLCGLPLCLSKRVYKLYSPLKVHQQLSPNRFSSASPLQLSFCKFSHKPTFRLHPFGLQNVQKFKVSILCSFLVTHCSTHTITNQAWAQKSNIEWHVLGNQS